MGSRAGVGLRGPSAEACSSPAHTQTCQAQPQTCWQNKQRQTQGTRPSLSARGRPAPAPALSPRGRAASEPRAPAHAQPFQGDRHGPHTKALCNHAPHSLHAECAHELPSTPTVTHRILPEPLGGSIAQNKLPGQRDREKLCFRGRRSPVGREARHEAPRGRGKPPGRQMTAAPRGVANSPDPRSCAGRARLPVLPARGRRSTRSSPAARPASPVPAPGPPRRPAPPARLGEGASRRCPQPRGQAAQATGPPAPAPAPARPAPAAPQLREPPKLAASARAPAPEPRPSGPSPRPPLTSRAARRGRGSGAGPGRRPPCARPGAALCLRRSLLPPLGRRSGPGGPRGPGRPPPPSPAPAGPLGSGLAPAAAPPPLPAAPAARPSSSSSSSSAPPSDAAGAAQARAPAARDPPGRARRPGSGGAGTGSRLKRGSRPARRTLRGAGPGRAGRRGEGRPSSDPARPGANRKTGEARTAAARPRRTDGWSVHPLFV